MITVRRLTEFDIWLKSLRDTKARAAISIRLTRIENGNLGDVKAIGDGVSEIRVHNGSGYRLYFTQIGGEIIILLCGGDKSSQSRDITKAKVLARRLK